MRPSPDLNGGTKLKKSKGQFFTGLVWLVPLVIVVWLGLKVLSIGIGIYNSLFQWAVPDDLPIWLHLLLEKFLLPVVILGLLAVAIWLFGGFIQKKAAKSLVNWFDGILKSLPGVGMVYSMVKDAINMLFGHDDNPDLGVCWVQFPLPGHYCPAKITERNGEWITLFIPTSPNPTNGFTMSVHQSLVVIGQLPTEHLLGYHMKLGVGVSDELRRELTALPGYLPGGFEAAVLEQLRKIVEQTAPAKC